LEPEESIAATLKELLVVPPTRGLVIQGSTEEKRRGATRECNHGTPFIAIIKYRPWRLALCVTNR